MVAVKGRALGRVEIAKRKALRRVGIGRPLFRTKLNKSLYDFAVAEKDLSAASDLRVSRWSNIIQPALGNDNSNLARAEANIMGRLANDKFNLEARKYNVLKGKTVVGISDSTLKRKRGVKGVVRLLMAGRIARRKLKGIKAIN